jgi:hypothetical protein
MIFRCLIYHIVKLMICAEKLLYLKVKLEA